MGYENNSVPSPRPAPVMIKALQEFEKEMREQRIDTIIQAIRTRSARREEIPGEWLNELAEYAKR